MAQSSEPPNPFVQIVDWVRMNTLFIDGLMFKPTPHGISFAPVWRNYGYMGPLARQAANED